jgi:20S proteasome alpha/beta subunit
MHTRKQVSALRREAERYQAVFGHPISARTLALRAAEALQGKGQWKEDGGVRVVWSLVGRYHHDFT